MTLLDTLQHHPYIGGLIKDYSSAVTPNGDRCTKCHQVLSSFLTGKNIVSQGNICDDCYYEEFGDEINDYPIGGCSRRVDNE
jgi:hypothetical protein